MKTKLKLLSAAESMVRTNGYNGFSFRDLAERVGIKSSSVHYHYATKEELGAELAKTYSDNFMTALGEPEALSKQGRNPIHVYVELFRHALVVDDKMCLCGLLGAESDSLPIQVLFYVKQFFEKNITWLTQAYMIHNELLESDAKHLAIETVSLLEGALMISKTLDDMKIFNQAVIKLME